MLALDNARKRIKGREYRVIEGAGEVLIEALVYSFIYKVAILKCRIPEMKKRYNIIWTKEAMEHIGYHQVDKYEIEEALSGKVYEKKIQKNRYIILGDSHGRILLIILDLIRGSDYELTSAYDAPDKMKKLYKRRIKR